MDLVDDSGWEKVVYRKQRYRKQKRADRGVSLWEAKVDLSQLKAVSACDVKFGCLIDNPQISSAAAKIDCSDLAAFFEKVSDDRWFHPEDQIVRFIYYLETAFSQVPFPWKIFKEPSISTLIDVPLSHIPTSVYQISVDWINRLRSRLVSLSGFQLWALDRILTEWAARQGDAKGAQDTCSKTTVPLFVALAMTLRGNPDSMITCLPKLRVRPKYQGQDKLPLIIWMMAQASQGDLSVGLYSWAHNLLPLMGKNNKCCSPESMDLILQLVEIILSNQEARTILVSGAVREAVRLIPPSSFEILVRLTFPASSARVEATKRFEAVYPLLKEVALARGGNKAGQIFTFSLKLTGEGAREGNPGLAKEAAAIAVWSLTENADCFEHWVMLFKEHLEASVALLRKLVDEWKDHSPKLSSSPRDTLTAMNSFREQNEKGISKRGANCSLYVEADKYCKLISTRLSPMNEQKWADMASSGGVSSKIAPKESLSRLMVDSEETEKQIASLWEAAAKMDLSQLEAFLADDEVDDEVDDQFDLWRFNLYLDTAFSRVSLQWLEMLKKTPLSKLIDVPISHIPKSVYETSADRIKKLKTDTLGMFVTWSLDCILEDWAAQKGDAHVAAKVVGLAMVLRSKPDAVTHFLPKLRRNPRYQGEDKLPLIVWMLAQASQGDLCGGLDSWANVLLPLFGKNNKCCSPESMDLILQLVEMILSNQEARTILFSGAVRQLIKPSSLEILVRLTFPASSARVEATKRFEAVYPLLKEVALAQRKTAAGQMFNFSLELAGEGAREGNRGLAKEAAAIAVWSLTENADCFEHWVMLYKEHLEASVALLRKLVDEWKDHSPKLSSTTRDTLTAMNSFREKNQKGISKRRANCSLYEEADKYCKLISTRLSPMNEQKWAEMAAQWRRFRQDQNMLRHSNYSASLHCNKIDLENQYNTCKYYINKS